MKSLSKKMGMVGWCKSVVYLASLGHPTDIGCYPSAGKSRGGMFYFFCLFTFIPFPLSPLSLSLNSSTISSVSLLPLGDDTKYPTRVDMSLNPNIIKCLKIWEWKKNMKSECCLFNATQCRIWTDGYLCLLCTKYFWVICICIKPEHNPGCIIDQGLCNFSYTIFGSISSAY